MFLLFDAVCSGLDSQATQQQELVPPPGVRWWKGLRGSPTNGRGHDSASHFIDDEIGL